MSSSAIAHFSVQNTPDQAAALHHESDVHKHRRRFIGPVPERIMQRMIEPTTSARKTRVRFARARDDVEEDEGVRDAIRQHALQFFIGHGGQREDWGESQERSVREEMYQRWKQSEWGRARARRREARHDKQWVGTSFDVGLFLGVDTFGGAMARQREQEASTTPGASTSHVTAASGDATTAGETFVTAPSAPQEPTPSLSIHPDESQGAGSDGSTTPLLFEGNPEIRINGQAWTESSASQASNRPLRSEEEIEPLARSDGLVSMGKRKSVHYVDEHPAPPHEVLQRAASQVHETSAGAAWQATAENQVKWGDVIMRDRMLVQVSFTNTESLPANFDEQLVAVSGFEGQSGCL